MKPPMRWLVVLGLLCTSAYGAPVAKARLTFGAPTVKGGLDANAVATVVQRRGPKLLACYTASLAKAPELQGNATATFTVGADGKVTAAKVKGLNDEAQTCISDVFKRLEFVKTKDGKPVDVTYPFTFRPGSD